MMWQTVKVTQNTENAYFKWLLLKVALKAFSYDFALRISLTKQNLLSAKSKEITDKQIIYKEILIM